jgi:hypothetical protein
MGSDRITGLAPVQFVPAYARRFRHPRTAPTGPVPSSSSDAGSGIGASDTSSTRPPAAYVRRAARGRPSVEWGRT